MSAGDPGATAGRAEALLRDAWCAAEGLTERPSFALHPADEMADVENLKVEPERRALFYLKTGHDAALVLDNVLRTAERGTATLDALLDFAAGYGRVTRFFARALDPRRVWVSDILAPAVAFQSAEFGVNGFVSRADPDAIDFPREFPAIFVGSLFSHLPRATFESFLRVLYTQLEPDGLLVFSTNSDALLEPAQRDPSGFTFELHSESRTLDVHQYGTTYVDPALVRKIAAPLGIAHLWRLERELWGRQDVYVAARRPIDGLRGWRPARVATGIVLRADVDRAGTARAEGYVRVPLGAEVRRIEIVVDGAVSFATAFRANPDLSASEGGAQLRQLDWYVEGPAQHLVGGVHTVAAVVELDGVRRCFDVVPLRARE